MGTAPTTGSTEPGTYQANSESTDWKAEGPGPESPRYSRLISKIRKPADGWSTLRWSTKSFSIPSSSATTFRVMLTSTLNSSVTVLFA